MWTSARKATVDVSRFVSTWWAATSAAAERGSSWATTSTPASKDPKVGHIYRRACCVHSHLFLFSVVVNWSTIWPWICVTAATREVWCFSPSKCDAWRMQWWYFAPFFSAVHKAPWVNNPAANMTPLSGTFIALEIGQWWQRTLSSLSYLHVWTWPVTLPNAPKIQIQGEVTTSQPK